MAASGIAGVLHWWNRQPYSLKEPLITHYPLASWARYVVLPGMELIVELAPVLSLFLLRRVSKRTYGVSGALALLAPLLMRSNPYDLLSLASHNIFGDAPQWVFLAVLTYASALMPITSRIAFAALVQEQSEGQLGQLDLRELSLLLAPFSLALLLLVSTREAFFPRYLLAVLAVLVIWLIKVAVRSDN